MHPKRKKKDPDYAKQKRAFDVVMESYRKTRANVTLIGCANLRSGKNSGPTVRDGAKPSPTEFRCDVEKVIRKVVAERYLQQFWATYGWVDLDEKDQELFSQRMLGDRRHSWEQRLGERFIKLGLFPPSKYMTHKR